MVLVNIAGDQRPNGHFIDNFLNAVINQPSSLNHSQTQIRNVVAPLMGKLQLPIYPSELTPIQSARCNAYKSGLKGQLVWKFILELKQMKVNDTSDQGIRQWVNRTVHSWSEGGYFKGVSKSKCDLMVKNISRETQFILSPLIQSDALKKSPFETASSRSPCDELYKWHANDAHIRVMRSNMKEIKRKRILLNRQSNLPPSRLAPAPENLFQMFLSHTISISYYCFVSPIKQLRSTWVSLLSACGFQPEYSRAVNELLESGLNSFIDEMKKITEHGISAWKAHSNLLLMERILYRMAIGSKPAAKRKQLMKLLALKPQRKPVRKSTVITAFFNIGGSRSAEVSIEEAVKQAVDKGASIIGFVETLHSSQVTIPIPTGWTGLDQPAVSLSGSNGAHYRGGIVAMIDNSLNPTMVNVKPPSLEEHWIWIKLAPKPPLSQFYVCISL